MIKRRTRRAETTHTDVHEHACESCEATTLVEVTGHGYANERPGLFASREQVEQLDEQLAAQASERSIEQAHLQVALMRCPACGARGRRFEGYVALRGVALALATALAASALWLRFVEESVDWGPVATVVGAFVLLGGAFLVVAHQWSQDVSNPPRPLYGAGEPSVETTSGAI